MKIGQQTLVYLMAVSKCTEWINEAVSEAQRMPVTL